MGWEPLEVPDDRENRGLLREAQKKARFLVDETLGDALEGEYSSLQLSELPEEQYEPGVRWDEWLTKHPKSKILHCDHCLPTRK